MRVRASRLLLLSVAFLAGAGGVQLAVAPASRAARAAAPRCSATQPSEAAVVTAAAAGAKAMEQARAAAEAAVSPPAAASKRKGAQTFGKPLVIGLSHKTATVEVREKLSIPEAQWNEAAAALVGYETVQEAAILSTCNRFEVYIVAEDHYAATRDVLSFLRGHSGLEAETLRPNLFMLQDEEATLHLLRVSSGLDSLVVGEGQILSQVKACYSHAIAPESESEPAGSAGKVLGRLLNSAVMAGKFVRSETQIAKGAVSISSAAVELAVLRAPLDLGMPLESTSVCVIGAGKMSRLLLTHLASHGVTKVKLLNRGRARAEELAAEHPELDVQVGLMDELWPSLQECDLAFTSTSATGCIVTGAELRERGWDDEAARPLSLIDISVPRNVDAECNDVSAVHAYNVDDLKQVVAKNQARRREKVLEAEVLLRDKLAEFVAWQGSLQYVPAISQLQAKFESVRASELEKATKKLKSLDPKQRQAVEVLTKGIINKLLHAPMTYLRSDDADGTKATVDQINALFQTGDRADDNRRGGRR
uniref:Glutamyl-tRNA reductase n=1 Tax=Emiliania huxleyi TaxID=2903 RepID=A0A6V2YHV8_EMIHU|mmetsp:Transcript_15293/g.45518  ORF Transcript_15293/g.45518 Transcript_15293/m.45518 type:complete len:535 (+) Transcript_15293:36-1640(+)